MEELKKIIDEHGLKISGMGVLLAKQDKIIEQNGKLLTALYHLETKLEAMMDEVALKRLEELKRKFQK